MNLYTYVKNNPVRYVDPLGLGTSGALGRGDDDEEFDWEEWLKALEKYLGKTIESIEDLNEYLKGKSLPIPILPGEYTIGDKQIKVWITGATVNIILGEGGITDIESVSSGYFTLKNYKGPLGLDVTYGYYNFKTRQYNIEGYVGGIYPFNKQGQF